MVEPSIPEPVSVMLESSSTGLIVVDMQNDFCHPKGKLFVPQSVSTIPNLEKLVKKARDAGVKIFYTQDWHDPKDPEFEIWGEHALAGTWGAEIVDQLKPTGSDFIVKKLRYDGFYGTSLDHLLRLHGIQHLLVTGTVANICVLHTAGSAALRWYKVYVPVDCVSALNDFDMKVALRQVSFLYRGILTRSDLITFRQ
ncbi:MAG: isochorismatase family cysteine hydrolase [Candidatus Caldarchaeum sp.]|nr:isochorismatase family cysteine hydrolase [Candidatus Caldarchaeum sp.]